MEGYTDYDLNREWDSGWEAGQASILDELADEIKSVDNSISTPEEFLTYVRNLVKRR